MSATEREINGLNVDAIEEAIATVGAQPAARRAPKTARTRWIGGFKVKSIVRNHSFLVDEPAHLAGEDEAPNAVEYVLGALGACLATGFVLNATRRGIDVFNVEVVLDSTQDNVYQFLGIEDRGHSGLDQIKAKLYVQGDADEATIRDLWEYTLKTSPVGNSLVHRAEIATDLSIVP